MSGAVHLQENETFSAELFHDETFASEEHGSDLLLEEDGDIYTLSRRKEGALLRDDRAIRSDFNALMLPGNLDENAISPVWRAVYLFMKSFSFVNIRPNTLLPMEPPSVLISISSSIQAMEPPSHCIDSPASL